MDSVTCYARSRTCARRFVEELRELHDAGLAWAFVGIESGCDEVLDYMRKGAKRTEHVAGGVKLKESGISMAAFVMPGLAGRQKEFAGKHIAETIRVLNEVQPSEVRVRSLAIMEAAPLYERWRSGEFTHPTNDQMIDELEEILGASPSIASSRPAAHKRLHHARTALGKKSSVACQYRSV